MRDRILAAFVLGLMLMPVSARGQDLACGIGHLATIEPDGSVSRGSKDRLRRAAASGVPLRVGWGLDANGDGAPDVSHWADAGFVTEFEGEVFAQITDIQRQSPLRGQARVGMPAGRQRWSGLVGTNGMLESHFDDESQPTSTRVRSTWCVDPRSSACAPQWRVVYRHDVDGRPLEGSKEALVDAVRRGASLRLAWGVATNGEGNAVKLEHVAEPVFLTVMSGEDVFVQLAEHIGQVSYAQPDGARFDRPSVMWRGLMGSNGTFDAVLVDRATGQEIRRMPQRAGVAWFAELPAADCDVQRALTLAVADGVRRQASAQPVRAPETFRVRLETTKGDIIIDVTRAWAPIGTDRFYELVRSGYYNDVAFSRVIAGRWAQFGISGDPRVANEWRARTIPDEPFQQSNTRGTVAFAFAVPNGRTTQVFINLGDNRATHDKEPFVPFGRVDEAGMKVVDSLYSGYGEEAGSGIRSGKQGPIFEGGNAYLRKAFPKLDYIIRATIEP